MADDKGYPYTTVPNKLRDFQSRLPGIGKPAQATQAWLKGLGYHAGNDMTVLSVARRVGIITQGGEPTAYWDAIRSKDGAKVAEHVRTAYRPLFDLYPNADQQDDEAIRNFFRSNTDAGEDAQRFMVRTFRVLCEPADFGAAPTTTQTPTPKPEKEKSSGGAGGGGKVETKVIERAAGGGLTLNVNIQLQLPASADGEVYEKLFEAMGKHLKGLANIE